MSKNQMEGSEYFDPQNATYGKFSNLVSDPDYMDRPMIIKNTTQNGSQWLGSEKSSNNPLNSVFGLVGN